MVRVIMINILSDLTTASSATNLDGPCNIIYANIKMANFNTRLWSLIDNYKVV